MGPSSKLCVYVCCGADLIVTHIYGPSGTIAQSVSSAPHVVGCVAHWLVVVRHPLLKQSRSHSQKEEGAAHGRVHRRSVVPSDWRAGASQPSRPTGTIFLFIYIYKYKKSFLLNEGVYTATYLANLLREATLEHSPESMQVHTRFAIRG